MLTACSLGGDFGGTRYQCGAGGRCPDGQACIAGFCEVGDSDAPIGTDDGGDGGVGDGGVEARVCGSLSLLSDPFEDGVAPPWFERFEETGVTVTETGGQLVVALAAGTGDAYGGYRSTHYYDLTSGVFETKVGQLGGVHTILEIRDHQDRVVQLTVEGASMFAAVYNVPGAGIRRTIPYDPAHTYWRLRVTGPTLFWETSANRTTWNLLHSELVPFDLRHVRGVLAAGVRIATASQARFDDVNLAVAAGPGYCSASTLVDDFAAAPFEPLWSSYANPGCTISETGGKAVMTFTGIGSVFCGLVARHLFDLREGEVVIDSIDLPSRTNFVTYLQVVSPFTSESRVEATLDGGTFRAVNRRNGVDGPSVAVPYDRVMRRYWRIRGVGNQLEVGTSPDKVGWTTHLTVTPGFDPAVSVISYGAGHYASVAPTGTVMAQLPGLNAP